MIAAPSFEHSTLVTDDAILAARISALFRRPGRYFPVLNAPRMGRQDAGNEITRCRNSLVLTRPRKVLLGGISREAAVGLAQGWGDCYASDESPGVRMVVAPIDLVNSGALTGA